MITLNLAGLDPIAAKKIQPFFETIFSEHQKSIHSLVITGSAITEDFDSKQSDVNSIIVLHEMDFKFLEAIATLGKKYGKKRVAAPLIMTPEYIRDSLDVFPIEFFNFKLIHHTIWGDDILDTIDIHPQDLRRQCEREIKTKLIGLRQGYLAAQADRRLLSENFATNITNDIPLFRGILFLLHNKTPVQRNAVIDALSQATKFDTSVFSTTLQVKENKNKPSIDQFNSIFKSYYTALEKLGKIVDEITI